MNANTALRWWEGLLLLAALSIFAAQLLIASPLKSAAFDEQYHLTAGYSYLRTGDFRLATTHPPLMGLIAALGLLGRDDLVLPLDHPAWQAGDRFLYSDVFLWEANDDPQGMLVAARRPIMMVGVLLVFALFCWARQLISPQAGWVVLLLAIFDPNLIGNSRVVTTDLGLACFLLLALWRLWCWLERRTWLNLALVGLCAGLAMCAKFTGLFFWPAAGLILLIYPAQSDGDSIWRRLVGLIGIGLVALSVTWAVYRFDFGPMTNGPIALPLPAPYYWQQLYNTFFRIVNLQGDRYDFFWGEASNQGWWDYFPVAMAVKTPLPLLILCITGLVIALRRHSWRRTSILWMLPLLFLVLGLSGILTIGYRHILPVVPFFILLAGYTAAQYPTLTLTAIKLRGGARTPTRTRTLTRLSRTRTSTSTSRRLNLMAVTLTLPSLGREQIRDQRRSPVSPPIAPSPNWGGVGWGLLLSALLIWSVAGSLRMFPHQEAFFNELAGDWYHWSNLLVDSNLDWGQDLPALRQTMADLGIPEVNLAYFGKAVPEKYGVQYRPLYGYLRFVDGMELNAYNPYTPEPGWYAISATSLRLGLHQADSIDLYAFFRNRRPDARAGYSTYLYNVTYPAAMPVDRKVIASDPLYRLSPEMLGVTSGRRIQAKWVQAPEAVVYPLGEGFISPEGWQAVEANFDDVFTLLGYTQAPTEIQAGQPVPITLYWQVGAKPMAMPAPTKGSPLSAFVHLTVAGEPGQKLAQFDGWSVALRGLEPGDVLVQSLQLDIPSNAVSGIYDLLVGLYSPQSFARLVVTNREGQLDYVVAGKLTLE